MSAPAGPLLITHEASLWHDTGDHPERIARIEAIEAALADRPELALDRRTARAATREELLRVHPESHLDLIESAAAQGAAMMDSETIISSGSWDAAVNAAGGAAMLVDELVARAAAGLEPARGFAIQRPPGHHAESNRPMGFCLFNNVAVAAEHARQAHGMERVAILDWDVHHGNGTNDIFHADPTVLFTSIHEYPLYPGTGRAADRGSGDGLGFTVNLPVDGGSGDVEFRALVDGVFVPQMLEFQPQLILVSAGFDAHERDPLSSCVVSTAGFASLARSVTGLADQLGVPLGLVLEGGYDLQGLAESCCAVLEVFGEPVSG